MWADCGQSNIVNSKAGSRGSIGGSGELPNVHDGSAKYAIASDNAMTLYDGILSFLLRPAVNNSVISIMRS